MNTYCDVLHLQGREATWLWLCASFLVLFSLLSSEWGLVLEYVHLHLDEAKLLKWLKYWPLNLSHVEVALHFLILVIFELIQLLRDELLHLKVIDLGLPFLICIQLLSLKLFHQLLGFLYLLSSRVSSILDDLHFVSIQPLFPFIFLSLLEHPIMVEKAQILKIEDMGQFDALCSLVHDSEENFSLVEGSHQELDMLSCYLLELLVLGEHALPLDPNH